MIAKAYPAGILESRVEGAESAWKLAVEFMLGGKRWDYINISVNKNTETT